MSWGFFWEKFMTPRQTTTAIVIHCSATPAHMDIGADEIRQWHQAKGWGDIGYHWVIRRNGAIERGRDQWRQGAHEPHYNAYSVAICMVGGVDEDGKPEDNFTVAQYASLKTLVLGLMTEYPGINQVCGHRDAPEVDKACPSFEVADFMSAITVEYP